MFTILGHEQLLFASVNCFSEPRPTLVNNKESSSQTLFDLSKIRSRQAAAGLGRVMPVGREMGNAV
jgi:hypothetical protein